MQKHYLSRDKACLVSTGLQLQMGGNVKAPIKLGGFPKSGLDKYIGKLVRAGYSVAVALQDDTKERHIKEIVRVQKEAPSRKKPKSRKNMMLRTKGNHKGLPLHFLDLI